MEYKLFRLSFSTDVHFGKDSLVNCDISFGADRLFSALCHEVINLRGVEFIDELVDLTASGRLRISDAFPFIGDSYYLPRPILTMDRKSSDDSLERKALKNLSYIPSDLFKVYLEGNLDVRKEKELLDYLGRYGTRSMAAVGGLDQSEPYSLETYSFNEGNGLYVLVGYGDAGVVSMMKELFSSLGYSGIGGRLSSGLGKFRVEILDVPTSIQRRLSLNSDSSYGMLLSSALPRDEELDSAMEGAFYKVSKRAGFVRSQDFDSMPRKKRDIYLFQAGSCFLNRFEGDVFDVSLGGSHSVYRYGAAMFLEV